MTETPLTDVRVIPARTVRVVLPWEVEVDLNLGFGVHAHRRVLLDGFGQAHVAGYGEQTAAMACAIMLLGDRRLWVVCPHTDDPVRPVRARVFVDEALYQPAHPAFAAPAYGRPPRLDAGAFLAALRAAGYAKDAVKRMVNRGAAAAAAAPPDGRR